MIVVMQQHCSDEAIENVQVFLKNHGLSGHLSRGTELTVIGVLGAVGPSGTRTSIGGINPSIGEALGRCGWFSHNLHGNSASVNLLALSLRLLKNNFPAFLLSSSLLALLTASRKRLASFSVSFRVNSRDGWISC